MELDNVDPVIEVFAKIVTGYHFRQVLVSRRQYAHIDVFLPGRADRPHLLFLDYPEQLYLHRQRQIGDFVQEQGAIFCALQEPGFVIDGACKTALAVAKKLAFHEFRGNRAAVYRYEGPFGARTAVVYQPGDQLFAGSRFAGNVHRCLGTGDAVDHLPQVVHLLRLAEQLGAVILPSFDAQGIRNNVSQIVQIKWFGYEVERTEFQRLHGRFNITVRCDYSNRDPGSVSLHPVHQVESVAVREAHVGQANIEAVLLEQRFRARDVDSRFAIDVHATEGQRQQFANVRLVIDDES